jgi:citrate lyase beta subunit
MEYKIFKSRRSLLFVPGNRLNLFPKALKTGADVVCLDLEDSIPSNQKAKTRRETIKFLESTSEVENMEVVLRINGLETHDGIKDIDCIMDSKTPPSSLMLTKIRNANEVRLLDKLLSTPVLSKIRFQVIIETNSALENVMGIATACERIDCLLFGGVDMAAELGTTFDWESMLYSRSRIVHAGASANIDIMDVPSLDINDLEDLKKTSKASAKLGFTGKAAIHPSQVPIINKAFTPDPEMVAEAKKIIGVFEKSENGIAVVDGKLLEKPLIRSMYRILALSERNK